MDKVVLLFALGTFLISLLMGLYIIPRIVLITMKRRLFDKVDHRKSHKDTVSRLGGFSFFPVMAFSFTLMLGLRYIFHFDVAPFIEPSLFHACLFMVAGLVLIFFVGLSDDLMGVGFKTKFAVQVISAAMLVMGGLSINNLEGLFGLHEIHPALGIAITILFIVFTINAYNLIDGVNGLCSGLSLVALLGYSGWFLWTGLYIYAMIGLSMAGILLAFFYYNTSGKRLKIFMGDTGSLTLGYLVTAISLLFINLPDSYVAEPYCIDNKLPIVAGLLFVPLFDALRVFTIRILRKQHPFHPDRNHIHHKLLDLGFSHIQSTILLILTQITYLIINVTLCHIIGVDGNITIGIDIALAVIAILIIDKRVSKLKSAKRPK